LIEVIYLRLPETTAHDLQPRSSLSDRAVYFPITSGFLRTHTILVFLFGCAAAVYTVGEFIQMLVDGELQNALMVRRMSNGIANLNDHTIICVDGQIGSMMARELTQSVT